MFLPGAAHAVVSKQTLKKLNTAFQGESDAANHYGKLAEIATAQT